MYDILCQLHDLTLVVLKLLDMSGHPSHLQYFSINQIPPLSYVCVCVFVCLFVCVYMFTRQEHQTIKDKIKTQRQNLLTAF